MGNKQSAEVAKSILMQQKQTIKQEEAEIQEDLSVDNNGDHLSTNTTTTSRTISRFRLNSTRREERSVQLIVERQTT